MYVNDDHEAQATPFVSESVPVSIFRTHVRHFKLHITTIFCPISGGLLLIGPEYAQYY